MSLVFPASAGGRAEEVRDFVRVRVEQFEAVSRSSQRARSARERLDNGIAALAGARYREAHEDFCVAYRHLATSVP
jgi:hypothetical protein